MRNSGEQSIILSDRCETGAVIHEIAHTVGLWHEQSREDRDKFVGIIWDNIVSGPTEDDDMRFNFDQHITDGDDVGPYDYCSIMHYGAWAFSIDGETRDKPTIDVLRSDLPCGDANSIGQRNGLSAGDIAAVIQMYANVIPGVGRNADGRLEVFLVGSDKQLHHRWQTAANSSTWSDDWASLGGEWWVGSNPAVAQNADGRIEVFLVGSDKQLHHKWQTKVNNSSQWSDGSPSLLNEWPDDSTVVNNADGRLEVYIVGSDEHLYHRWQTAANSSQWSVWTEGNFTTNWNSLWGQFSLKARPAVARNADGRLAVFMVFLDRRLYVTSQIKANDSTRAAWDGWNVLGMQYLWPDDPVVAQNADGRLEVFLVGSDRRLYHKWQTAANSSTWSDGWASLGGQWSHRRRPAVAQNADGRLEVFLVGLDKQLHHRSQTAANSSQWSEIWTVLGGQEWPPSSDPSIGRNADGRLEVFLVGSDKQLYHRRQTAANSSTWSETWTSLGGGPFL
jgi:acylphosphatase